MRLPNGYGSVVKLKGNRRKPYAVRITTGFKENETNEYGIIKYTQTYKYLGYFKTKNEALACLVGYNENPYDIDAKKITFLELWNEWLSIHSDKVAKSSLSVYKTAFNKCEPLHKIAFANLRAFHFQTIIDKSENYSGARIVKIVAGLLYKYAIKNEIVDKNYAELLELPKKTNKKEKRPFTIDNINTIWKNENTLHGDMLLILLYTGMRISELLQLETKNIDLDNRIMVGGIKTEYGKNRTIPIHNKILPIIKRHIGKTYLFEAPRGGMYHYSNEGLKINKTIKSLGIDRTIHETRHTFISQCDRLGMNQLIVKRIVGHSTKDITEHYTFKDNKDLIDAIDMFEY